MWDVLIILMYLKRERWQTLDIVASVIKFLHFGLTDVITHKRFVYTMYQDSCKSKFNKLIINKYIL